ncbi:MAG: TonB-dependent receptor [Melioribacteraceae bacterium]|nr:TonB-dependent receptor [Melioribacteraceae bacterium]
MRIKFVSFLIFLTLMLNTNLDAGTTGKITGKVVDAVTGEPLIGVNVMLEGTFYGASTDVDGEYLLLNIPPGRYNIKFSYISYQSVVVSDLMVNVDFTTRQDIEMTEKTLELGETVVVTSGREIIRKDLTSSQAIITTDDIKSLPAEDFVDILQIQAGVTRGDDGLHIRGGRSSEVSFKVDGLSVTDVFDGTNGVEIENNAIQSMQVISGTFNAEYGQAMSGIINVVTKDGGKIYNGEVSAYMGDYISDDKEIFMNIDDVNATAIYNYSFSLSGPIPLTNDAVTFFVNFRENNDDGYFYGKREYNTDGSIGDNEFVTMNRNKWTSLQSKVTWNLIPTFKVRFGFNYENRKYNLYDHFYKFNPDANLNRFQKGYNGSISINHTLNQTTFYTVKYGRFEKEYEHYVYENPADKRFVDNSDPRFAVSSFEFSNGGQINNHFLRNTLTDNIKFDITSQITSVHLIKFGVEGRLHKLNMLNYNTIDGSPSDTNFTPIIPQENHINFGKYEFTPFDIAAYIQDKIEFEDFIINVGLRFDYFDSKGNILTDPKDPSRYTPLRDEYVDKNPNSLTDIWYKKTKAKYGFSPRLGMSFPISDAGVIHASYGHFLQFPQFRLLYENPGFKINRGQFNLLGNADLDPQKTVMYEIGLQQQISELIAFDITGFYRDIRDWVGTSLLQETYRPDVLYSQYENRDYANIRGITLSLKKTFANHFAANVSYTFQVAEGSASDPIDGYNDIQANKEPRRNIIPMDWDRSHVINANVFGEYKGISASIIARFESGLPYTPNPVQGTQRGADVTTGSLALTENSKRRPNLFTIDYQMSKEFSFSIDKNKTSVTLFFKVFNLLDTRNEQGVWDDTGRATYTLQSSVSGADADPRYIIRPDFYSSPRRVQLGLSFNFN